MSAGLRSALGWGAVQTVVRLILSFLSIKVTAVFLGPTGIALVGQLGNFITLVQGVLANAIQSAVVKMTAESEAQGDQRLLPLWGTSIRLVTMLGVVAGALVIIARKALSGWLFGMESLWPIVVLMGVILPLGMLYQVLNGILTGRRQFQLIAFSNIGVAIAGAAIFVSLSYWFGITGGLVGATLACGVGVPVVVVIMRRLGLFHFSKFLSLWRRDLLPSIFSFYPMLLVHAATAPLVLLLVRDALIGAAGVEQAGLWQASLRLSDMYTGVLLTALGMYSLPTLSAIKEPAQFRKVLFAMVFKMGALTATAAATIFLCRDLIVRVVFTAQFLPVRDLLGYQLLGDVLNLAAWPMRSALMAQQRPRTYMAVEAGIGVIQVAFTYLLISKQGVSAGPVAYATTWGIAFVALLILHRRTGQYGAIRNQEGASVESSSIDHGISKRCQVSG